MSVGLSERLYAVDSENAKRDLEVAYPHTPAGKKTPEWKAPVPPTSRRIRLADRVLVREGDDIPAVWLIGAHGGAGVTTLSHVWAPMGDAGHVWPVHDQHRWCVVVARATHQGLDAAADVGVLKRAGQIPSCHLLGFLLVADSPQGPSKLIRRKMKTFAAGGMPVWQVPYLKSWAQLPVKDLPVWQPGGAPAKRSRFKKPSPNEVPDRIAHTGADILDHLVASVKETRHTVTEGENHYGC